MARTIRGTVAAFLIRNGWTQVTPNRPRYWTFAKEGKSDKFYLGPCGSVRFGRTRTDSRAVGLIGQFAWIENQS